MLVVHLLDIQVRNTFIIENTLFYEEHICSRKHIHSEHLLYIRYDRIVIEDTF
jgi:hypothetical protein